MENGSAISGGRSEGRPRIVVVGSGFAGFTCARELERRLGPEDAELVLASPTDYLLYSPLLPEVATGAQDARNIAVPLHGVLKRTRIILGRHDGRGPGSPHLHRETAQRVQSGCSDGTGSCWRRGASRAPSRSPASPSGHAGSSRWARRCTCATTSSGSWSWPTPPTTPTSAGRAAPSWWSARGTSAPSSRRRCSTSPGRYWETTRAWSPGTCAGCSSTWRRGCCPSSASAWEGSPSGCSGGAGSRFGSRPA